MAPSAALTGGNPRMRVLCVLSSSNQLYSGIGRNLFEAAARLADRIEYEFAIDDQIARNVDCLRQFAGPRGMPVHAGRGRSVPEALDRRNDDLPALLRQGRWDVIECLCFANAATNADVLEHVGAATLAYTPHDQPTWTVPMTPEQAEFLESVHRRVLNRADVVLCDTPHERRQLQRLEPGRNHCTHVPIGCDFRSFRPGGLRRKDQLLFVGDLAEPRKRFDRVLAVFARLIRRRPELRLIVIGNRSDAARDLIPRDLRHACDLRGYVPEIELRRTYAESLGLLLLSDFEAFGVPILESLACGTPVFLSRQAATESLFGDCLAAHFCPADDPDATAQEIERALGRGRDAIAEALADRRRLAGLFNWDLLAFRKWQALASAWFLRTGRARVA